MVSTPSLHIPVTSICSEVILKHVSTQVRSGEAFKGFVKKSWVGGRGSSKPVNMGSLSFPLEAGLEGGEG